MTSFPTLADAFESMVRDWRELHAKYRDARIEDTAQASPQGLHGALVASAEYCNELLRHFEAEAGWVEDHCRDLSVSNQYHDFLKELAAEDGLNKDARTVAALDQEAAE